MGKAEEEGRREGWEETRCEEGVLFARRNSARQAPVFQKLPAFIIGAGQLWPFPPAWAAWRALWGTEEGVSKNTLGGLL